MTKKILIISIFALIGSFSAMAQDIVSDLSNIEKHSIYIAINDAKAFIEPALNADTSEDNLMSKGDRMYAAGAQD